MALLKRSGGSILGRGASSFWEVGILYRGASGASFLGECGFFGWWGFFFGELSFLFGEGVSILGSGVSFFWSGVSSLGDWGFQFLGMGILFGEVGIRFRGVGF